MVTGYKKSLIVAIILLCTLFLTAQAQQDDYRLNVNRTFGYSNGGQIRGTFTLSIVGSGNMRNVRYMIDDQQIAELTSDPFTFTFQTSKYPNGWHDLTAIIETNDGKIITTPVRRLNFATAEEESSGTIGIIVPVVGVIALVLIGVVVFQTVAFRKKPLSTLPLGAARNYGIRGGTICPHCRRPYAIHWWAVNIGLRNRVDRCDFCGKWSIVRPLGSNELEAAVTSEVDQAQASPQIAPKTEQDRLKEMVENSRYTNE